MSDFWLSVAVALLVIATALLGYVTGRRDGREEMRARVLTHLRSSANMRDRMQGLVNGPVAMALRAAAEQIEWMR